MGDDCIPEDVADMTGSFVLCLDGLAGSGDFVWSKWLLKAVKSGRSVVLVSMRHSPEHYEALFKKSMLDLFPDAQLLERPDDLENFDPATTLVSIAPVKKKDRMKVRAARY